MTRNVNLFFAFSSALCILGGGSASAQMACRSLDGLNQSNCLQVQVQISLQRPLASADDGPEAQGKAMESARQAIYDSIKSECGMLSASFGSDCRLVNINAGSSIMARGNMSPAVNANGNASFELTPRRAETPAAPKEPAAK